MGQKCCVKNESIVSQKQLDIWERKSKSDSNEYNDKFEERSNKEDSENSNSKSESKNFIKSIHNFIVNEGVNFDGKPMPESKHESVIERSISNHEHSILPYQDHSEIKSLKVKNQLHLSDNEYSNIMGIYSNKKHLNQIKDAIENVTKSPPSATITKSNSIYENALKSLQLASAKKNKERPKIMSIEEILPKEKLDSLNPEEILFEGELVRYHPGFKTHLSNRWFQLTKSSLSYYKNQISAKCYESKPIAIIPIKYIKNIERVTVLIPEDYCKHIKEKNQIKKSWIYENQFEIFTKEEILGEQNEFNKLKQERDPIPEKEIEFKTPNKIEKSKKKLEISLGEIDNHSSASKKQDDSKTAIHENDIDNFNKNLFNSKLFMYSQEGHLMKSPLYNSYCNSSINK